MTDATKWKSVMLRIETHEKLGQLVEAHGNNMSAYMTYLIDKAWDAQFKAPAHNPFKGPPPGIKYHSKV